MDDVLPCPNCSTEGMEVKHINPRRCYKENPPAPPPEAVKGGAAAGHWVQDETDLRVIRTKKGQLIGRMELALAAFAAVRAVNEAHAEGKNLLAAPTQAEAVPAPAGEKLGQIMEVVVKWENDELTAIQALHEIAVLTDLWMPGPKETEAQAEAVKADPGAPAREFAVDAATIEDLMEARKSAAHAVRKLDQHIPLLTRLKVPAALPTGADPARKPYVRLSGGTHHPTCPYASKEAAKGHGFADCNCDESYQPPAGGKDGEPSASLREPKTALEAVLAEFSTRDLQMNGKCSHVLTRDAQERVYAIVTNALSAAQPPVSEANGSPSSLPAPSPGETALDLEAVAVIKGYRDIAEDLLRKAINIANEPSPKWYKDSDAKISAIKGLAEVWDQDAARMRARLRSTPGAQESRPLTWTMEKPVKLGYYYRRYVSNKTNRELERDVIHYYERPIHASQPASPEARFEWAGPLPEPQTLSEGGATA